ncbi:DnaJ homolog subfamily C member 7 [Durusdinium trenchii]|uniref:DnaJ homolog subfamily C member 7 n=1 Tax=Durusdinium trenchii TaxID=1381693 RepID=A0ABP0NHH4_9DINO
MSHIFGCKQTPPTPPTTSDEESSGSTSDAETKKKKGNRAMGKKKYPKAIKYYSKAIKIDPENATYHLNRAIANSALELWKDAELDAAKAVELADQQAPAKRLGSHYQLVRARLRRGRCLEAREALKLGLQRFSEDKALQQLGKEVDRAVALLEAKRRKEAVAEQSAPPRGRGGVEALKYPASNLQEEEEEERSAAKSAGPCGAKALTDQARQLSERQPEAALPLLEEALQAARQARQRREEINAQSLMGKVQLKLRRWAEAVASWEAVVQLEGEQFSMEVLEERLALSNAQNNLGIALKNAQRLGEASSAFQEAYRLATNGDDKASQILQNAAQCLLAQGRAVEAKGLCERSQEICLRLFGEKHGTLALGHLALARCCRAAGTEPTRACEANSTVGGAACFGLNLFSWTQLTWKWEKCILFWTLSLSLSLSRSLSLSLALALPTWKWKGHLLFVEEGFWSFQGPTIATSMIVLERERESRSFWLSIDGT